MAQKKITRTRASKKTKQRSWLKTAHPTNLFIAIIATVAIAVGGLLFFVTNAKTPSYANPFIAHAGARFVGKQRCLDDSGGLGKVGDAVQLWDCTGKAPQQWSFSGAGAADVTGAMTVLGKCLDVPNGVKTAGTPLRLWGCNNAPAQKWRIMADGSVVNPNSGLCLNPAAGSSATRTKITIDKCNNSNAQKWANTALYSYQIKGTVHGKCLDDSLGKNVPGNRIQVYQCANNALGPKSVWAQQWTLPPYPNNTSFAIRATLYDRFSPGVNEAGVRCLDIPNGSKTAGTGLRLWDCNGSTAQEWVKRNGGFYNPNSNMCLDAQTLNNAVANLAPVQIWACNGANAQKWTIQ